MQSVSGPGARPARWWATAVAVAGLGLWGAQALAADGATKAPSEAIFVAQVVALLLVGRVLGEVMLRLGQPAVVGQLIAGIALGPSLFGLVAPHWQAAIFPADAAQKAMTGGVAQLGVLLLLLLTGMETDVALVRRVGRPAAAVSLSGIAVPFVCGVAVGLYALPQSLLPDPGKRLVTALFLGTALSISSIKIVAMVIDEMHFMRRNLGQIIVASAIIDDTVGWIIIAVTFGLARPEGLDWGHLALSVGGVAAFMVLSATLGRRLVAALMRWANDRLVSDLAVVTLILVIMGLMALATDAIGVNTVLGAFVAGVLVGQSPILTGRVEKELRGLVTALFAPIFFGLAGLGTDLTILKDPALLALTVGLILIASVGKFGGAFLGGTVGGLTRQESLALALGMNARGSTEVIVATIGLSIGALNHTLFTMIVTMAVVTTTIMPPTLRWALARLPLREEEAGRLAREAFEESGFIGNVERLLLARGDGPSGRLAARLAGALGGSRGLPVTVMAIGRPEGGEAASAEVAQAAEAAAAPSDTDKAAEADVTLRPLADAPEHEAVAAEAGKGYGLLMIGLDPATRAEGGLEPRLAKLVQSFEGARAVVVARGPHRGDPDVPLRILVPTDGTATGRRAAEVAFALAKATAAYITVMFVADPPAAANGSGRRRPAAAPVAEDILADMREVAKQFEVETETVVRVAVDRTASVLGQARRAGDTLIVLGVQPRPGDSLPFGALAHGLLEGSDHSMLLVVGDNAVSTGAPDRR